MNPSKWNEKAEIPSIDIPPILEVLSWDDFEKLLLKLWEGIENLYGRFVKILRNLK